MCNNSPVNRNSSTAAAAAADVDVQQHNSTTAFPYFILLCLPLLLPLARFARLSAQLWTGLGPWDARMALGASAFLLNQRNKQTTSPARTALTAAPTVHMTAAHTIATSRVRCSASTCRLYVNVQHSSTCTATQQHSTQQHSSTPTRVQL